MKKTVRNPKSPLKQSATDIAPSKEQLMARDNILHVGVCIIIALYLVIGFIAASDYGMTMHGEDCMGLGHKYMHYYFSGELDFSNIDSPCIPGIDPHLLYAGEVNKHPEYFYPFDAFLSTITCWIFYQKIHILDHVTAHAISITFLTAFFLYFLYRFVARHWTTSIGLLSVVILISCPRFFGETMYNFRADVALLILFSFTVMSLSEWLHTAKAKYIYFTAIAFACGAGTKPDIIFAFPIVMIWFLPSFFRAVKKRIWMSRTTLLHLCLAGLLALLILIALYPIFHPFQGHQLDYLMKMYHTMRAGAFHPMVTWNLYAPIHILYTTPEIVLFFFGCGVAFAFAQRHTYRFNSLLFIWVLFPILRHCLPHMNHYDGLRHFLFFYVPFGILAAIGVHATAHVVGNMVKIPSRRIMTGLATIILVYNGYALVTTHPYQTTYFNALIGGLKGAQSQNFPFACDYMAVCHREVGKWLNVNAKPNAHFFTGFGQSKFRHHISRPDLHEIPTISRIEDIAPNSYLIEVPRDWWGGVSYQYPARRLFIQSHYPKAYEIKRQGGEIATIYYNP